MHLAYLLCLLGIDMYLQTIAYINVFSEGLTQPVVVATALEILINEDEVSDDDLACRVEDVAEKCMASSLAIFCFSSAIYRLTIL